MAQWYTQLLFSGDTFLGDAVADFSLVEGVALLNGRSQYTTVIISGYALYGELRGFFAAGVAHIGVDPSNGQASYLSEKSALHLEPVGSLTAVQRTAIREWLINLDPSAWENSTIAFKRSLDKDS